MTTLTPNELLLHEICDLIPDRDTAALILAMDPDDHLTFAEAYCAVRTLSTLTPDLRRRLLAKTYDLANRETAELLAANGDGSRRATASRTVVPTSAAALTSRRAR